jgi:Fe-S cluster assembly protein SufD
MNIALTTPEAHTAEFVAGFDEEAFVNLDTQSEPSLLRAAREAAFSRYRTMPAPRATDEEWRRTNPALFPFSQLKRLPSLHRLPEMDEGPWDNRFDVVVSVNDSGFAVRDISGVLKHNRMVVCSLAQAAERSPEVIRKFISGDSLRGTIGKFHALNRAFWNVGFLVQVPEKVELERGVLIRYEHEANHSILLPRLLVIAGRNSRATVVEHFSSADQAVFMAVAGKEMYVEEGARLQMVTLQEWGTRSYLIEEDWAQAQRNAQMAWITLNFGSRVGKMKFASDVAGPGSSAELDGIYFAAGDQHLDQKTLQVHSSRETYSRLLYKGAVKDKSHSVYQGLIQAKPGAVKVDAYQTNNNLVLSDGARADTIPGLLIDADDLKCSHGATIGNLDPNQIFYLRSRGLSEAEARKIAIFGFFEEVLKRIPYDFLRERVHENIDAKLNG